MIKEKRTIIVNEKDEIIGYKDRGDIKTEDIYRVSALLINNSKGEFLLAQRGYKKRNNPGVWNVSVAGTVEEGETYDENIIHEIEEEIGVKGLKLKKVKKFRRYGKHNFFVQFFTAILDKEINDFKLEENKVEQVRWFTREEILKGEFEGNFISKNMMEYIELF